MSNNQIILTIITSLVGGGTLATFITLWFTRKKTSAEAKHELSQADKTDADASGIYFGQAKTLFEEMREMLGEVRALNADLMASRLEVAQCFIKVGDLTAENERLKTTLKLVREENVKKDELISELNERLG